MYALINRLAALIMLIMAGVHGYRVAQPFDVMIAGQAIPQNVSLPAAVILAVLAIGLYLGARRV